MMSTKHLERWGPVLPLLEEFRTYLASDAPVFEILVGSDKTWANGEYPRQRKTGIYGHYGVYLLFCEEGRLQYVGKALDTFDRRIWSHDHDVPRRWIDLIPFEHGWSFMVPALEYFLIVKLNPPGNTQYAKGYTIGERDYRSPIIQNLRVRVDVGDDFQ